MLKLTYTRKNDEFQTVTVIGNAEGIRDLYWQLSHNYKPQDGTAIGKLLVTNLDGVDCTADIMARPYTFSSKLSILDR